MIHCILVPLDGSEAAEAGLAYAGVLHRAFGSRIILLRVVETAPETSGIPSESVTWRLAEIEAHRYLSRVAERMAEDGIPTEIAVGSGSASEEILDAMRRWGSDLVVLADHGKGDAVSFPRGGTAGKVISAASSSLLLVRGARDGEPSDRFLRQVIMPMDGSSRSEWPLNPAATLARATGADLHLVHVVRYPEFLRLSGASAESGRLADRLVEVNRAAAARYLDERRRRIESPDLSVRTRVAVASGVARAIHEIASEPGSLIVLTAHGSSPGSGWSYGGVASALVTHGSSPVLVFQDLPRRRRSHARRPGRYVRDARDARAPEARARGRPLEPASPGARGS